MHTLTSKHKVSLKAGKKQKKLFPHSQHQTRWKQNKEWSLNELKKKSKKRAAFEFWWPAST